jgi:hypothetical protein
MAFSAARSYAGPVFNLNERPQVKVARVSSLIYQEYSLVHALVPQQFIGQKLHLHSVALKKRGRHSQVVRASRGQGSIRRSQPGDAVPGDPNLQNELVDMLRLEVAKAQMSMFCDAEADKLREIAAEGLKELDRKYQNTITNSINEVDAEGERVSWTQFSTLESWEMHATTKIANSHFQRQSVCSFAHYPLVLFADTSQ